MELFENISDVSATSLITLYCRAIESQSNAPIIHDPKAVEITQHLNPILAKANNKLYRNLAAGKIDKKLILYITLRAKRYDQYAQTFLEKSPDGIIVNIGCGLDTRFFRIDNGQVNLYDLDFPALLAIKKGFVDETDRYRFIASSALDHDWMEQLSALKNRPFLFMAEGVFMYLPVDEVKSLVLTLQANFPGAELVCEMFNSFWLKKSLKWMIDVRMKRQLQLGKGVIFSFGIRDSRELEQWHDGIQFLDEWSYMDEPEPRLGALRFFRHINLFRKTQWTVRYRLGQR